MIPVCAGNWRWGGEGSGLILALLTALASQAGGQPECPAVAQEDFRGFIENNGQWDTEARFVAESGALVVRAEAGSIVAQRFATHDGRSRVAVVRMVFEGSSTVEPRGVQRLSSEFHYLKGSDPARWRRHVSSYADVVYPDLQPGMNLKLYCRDGAFEYDVQLAPTAAVEHFVVRCEGVDELRLDTNGALRMQTPLGALVQSAPKAWQVLSTGEQIPAACAFRILDSTHFGFSVADRVPGCSLVVDPGLSWATFLGGTIGDFAAGVQVSGNGNIVVLGRTRSPDFPTTAGVFDTTIDDYDLTLTCFEPSGSSLVFSTVVGGTTWEYPQALALSDDGRIAIGGWSNSTDYPALPSSYDPTSNGNADVCISLLAPDGSDLLFSTYLGGSGQDMVAGSSFMSNGSLVVAGRTSSGDFPTTPSAFDTSWGGQDDGFVACFDPEATGPEQLVWSSFLGSTDTDWILGLALGSDDGPTVVGQTQSSDFPTTPGAYDDTPSSFMGFMSRLSADGSTLLASSHFQNGVPYRVVSEGATTLVAGYHGPFGFPASVNAFDSSWNGSHDCFVARFDDALSQIFEATLVGGNNDDDVLGLTVDAAGRIIIVGATQSTSYPTTPGAFDTMFGGTAPQSTSIVSYLSSDLSQLLYSSYLGPPGMAASFANGVAAIGVGDVVIVGQGATAGFPVTAGAFDETYNGGGDGYVARMLMTGPWGYFGGAIIGSNGTPTLVGAGELVGGTPLTLTLTRAKPQALATLVLGLSVLNVPFKGGNLVPSPYLLVFGLPVGSDGKLVLSSVWPSGLPSGFSFYTQYWVPDPAGPAGLAASNGLSGTTP